MRKLSFVVGLVAALAMVGTALAQDAEGKKKGRRGGKGKKAAGTFVSAAAEGGTVTWKVNVESDVPEEAGEKSFAMSDQVLVVYGERKGAVVARMIRAKGKKPPKAPKGGKAKIFDGTFVSAAAGSITVKGADVPAEGEAAAAAAERTFKLSAKIGVAYRDAGGTLKAMAITAARAPRKAKGDRPDRPKKAGKGGRKKKTDAPDNL